MLRRLISAGLIAVPVAFGFSAGPAIAGGADVESVEVRRTGEDTYRFAVTVRHGDEGWDHYANKWVVETMDGKLLDERVLYHPHVEEQPFTRSLSGVKIPPDIETVTVRARDSVHGYEGRAMTVRVPD
jgi:hypothetical protein